MNDLKKKKSYLLIIKKLINLKKLPSSINLMIII